MSLWQPDAPSLQMGLEVGAPQRPCAVEMENLHHHRKTRVIDSRAPLHSICIRALKKKGRTQSEYPYFYPLSIMSLSTNNTSSGTPSKVTGKFHATKGTFVEALGKATGSLPQQQKGLQERAAGEAEYQAAKVKGYTQGASSQLGGKKDAVLGAVTGDRKQEATGHLKHDQGHAQKAVNQPF